MVEQPAMMELVRLPNTVMDIIFQKKVQLLTILSGLQPRADNQPHQKINWRYNMHRLTLHYLESMNYL